METQGGGGGGGGGQVGPEETATLGHPPVDHGRGEAGHAIRASPPSEDSGVELSNGGRKRSSKGKRENGKEGVTWADDAANNRVIAKSQEFDGGDSGKGRYESVGGEVDERHSPRPHPNQHHHHHHYAASQPEQEKILVKRFSERQLPKLHDVLGGAKVECFY